MEWRPTPSVASSPATCHWRPAPLGKRNALSTPLILLSKSFEGVECRPTPGPANPSQLLLFYQRSLPSWYSSLFSVQHAPLAQHVLTCTLDCATVCSRTLKRRCPEYRCTRCVYAGQTHKQATPARNSADKRPACDAQGVLGVVIVNNQGKPLRSTLDVRMRAHACKWSHSVQSWDADMCACILCARCFCLKDHLTRQYAELLPSLADLARNLVRDLDPQVR